MAENAIAVMIEEAVETEGRVVAIEEAVAVREVVETEEVAIEETKAIYSASQEDGIINFQN